MAEGPFLSLEFFPLGEGPDLVFEIGAVPSTDPDPDPPPTDPTVDPPLVVSLDPRNRIYNRLPMLWEGTSSDSLLLGLCEAFAKPSAYLEETVRGDETHDPWSIALDVNNTPRWTLPWLASVVGEEWRGPAREAIRERLITRPRFRRGTVNSIVEITKSTLIGNKTIGSAIRVNGDPNQMSLITLPEETPSPLATRTAIRKMAPVWVKVTHNLSVVDTIDSLDNVAIDSLPNLPIDQITT